MMQVYKYKRYLKLRSPKMTMWAGAVLGSVAFKACSITRSCVIRYCTRRRGEEEEDKEEEEEAEKEVVVWEAKPNRQQQTTRHRNRKPAVASDISQYSDISQHGESAPVCGRYVRRVWPCQKRRLPDSCFIVPCQNTAYLRIMEPTNDTKYTW